ncbi:MAG TPA: DUF3866 family protein [Actinomycetota bacterium]|nr:DUF3866 family protein [Actinomycetota bacterium]
MAAFREGKVVELLTGDARALRLRVALGTQEIGCVAFPSMVGELHVGDRVVVNTTGLELELGTGGDGFVLWNLDGGDVEPGEGHIVKLRYTPWQTEVLAAEAQESEHHHLLRDVDSIDGLPVVACGLHSQVAGVAAGIKAAEPGARVAYLMSDGGSLPIAWSRTIARLKEAGLVDVTCTYGHAFGGDIEAVNLFSGLAALATVARPTCVIAAMGPGGVGTGTRLGFSGIEQSQVLDATGALGGRGVACLRVSFSDARERHQGISHHSLTALRLAARPATIVIPDLPDEDRRDLLVEQLGGVVNAGLHEVVTADGSSGLDLLRRTGIEVDSMGRSLDESTEPFLAAAAAGAVAAGTARPPQG